MLRLRALRRAAAGMLPHVPPPVTSGWQGAPCIRDRAHLCHCCNILLPSQLCCVPNPEAHQQSEAPAVHHWSEACYRLALQICLGHVSGQVVLA